MWRVQRGACPVVRAQCELANVAVSCETLYFSFNILHQYVKGFVFVCLFIWLCRVLVVVHRIFVAACGIFCCVW